jgi:hypothetical protein
MIRVANLLFMFATGLVILVQPDDFVIFIMFIGSIMLEIFWELGEEWKIK